MKTFKTVATLFAFFAAFSATANEDKYPAWDFKPSVIYSNEALINSVGSLASQSSSNAVSQSAPAQPTHTVEADPKYPAAYFSPSVIIPSH